MAFIQTHKGKRFPLWHLFLSYIQLGDIKMSNKKQSINLMLEKLDGVLSHPIGETLQKSEQYAPLKQISSLVKKLKIEAGLKSIKNQLVTIHAQGLTAHEMFEKMSLVETQIEEIFSTARGSMKDKPEQSKNSNYKSNSSNYNKPKQNKADNNHAESEQSDDCLYS